MGKESLFMGPDVLNINIFSERAHQYRVKYLYDHHFEFMQEEKRKKFLTLVLDGNKKGILDFYEETTGRTLFYPESECIEQKSMIWISSDGSAKGIEEKASVLASFTNARTGGCQITGINKDLHVTGVENELLLKGISRELAESRIRNTLGQLTSHDYIRKCKFSWISVEQNSEKHLLLRIDAPSCYSDVVVVSGNKVPLRSGATTRLLKGEEMVNFIKDFYNTNNNN